jgi:hypothetical protein
VCVCVGVNSTDSRCGADKCVTDLCKPLKNVGNYEPIYTVSCLRKSGELKRRLHIPIKEKISLPVDGPPTRQYLLITKTTRFSVRFSVLFTA